MSMPALVADLKASLLDAASAFRAAEDADFRRHLTRAAEAFAPLRPRTEVGMVTLQAEAPAYPAPADLYRFKSALWGVRRAQPWEPSWPGRLPGVTHADGLLWLSPPPTAHQIAVLGADYRFFYLAHHEITDDGQATTLPEGARGLLLLRAQAEALRELAMRDAVRPVSARDGYSGVPKTGTPGWLSEQFLREFERRARAH